MTKSGVTVFMATRASSCVTEWRGGILLSDMNEKLNVWFRLLSTFKDATSQGL